jgi:D-alanyl-D-alanine carboxypeptidase
LKITLKVKSGSLTAQATGQKAFNLTPYSELEFRFSLAGIVLMFESGGNEGDSSDIDYTTFELQQGGGKYVFTRE